MWALEGRHLYEGYDAFRVTLLRLPMLAFIGRLMSMEAFRVIGWPIYRLVAENRQKLGCSSQRALPNPKT